MTHLIRFVLRLLAAIFRVLLGANSQSVRTESDWLPGELRGAEIAYAEETFRSQKLRLSARLDRAYRVNQEIVLVELKTRRFESVYRSDVIELSAQRVALMHEKGEPVSKQAFVFIEPPGGGSRVAKSVKLLEEEDVVSLMKRYECVRTGSVESLPARTIRLCESCAYRNDCRARFGDRCSLEQGPFWGLASQKMRRCEAPHFIHDLSP